MSILVRIADWFAGRVPDDEQLLTDELEALRERIARQRAELVRLRQLTQQRKDGAA